MDRIKGIQHVVDNWEYKRVMTDEEIKSDYIALLTRIHKLENKLKRIKLALEEE